MADSTLKDVLEAIAQLDGKVSTLDAKLSMVAAKVDAHRAETRRGFPTSIASSASTPTSIVSSRRTSKR